MDVKYLSLSRFQNPIIYDKTFLLNGDFLFKYLVNNNEIAFKRTNNSLYMKNNSIMTHLTLVREIMI